MAGIALMGAALACFCCLDTTAKWLGHHIDTALVVWARYASAFVLTILIVNPWTVPGLIRTRRPALQLGRSTLLFASTVCNFVALHYLRLDQTMSIVFTTPFFVVAMAGPLLGEWIGWKRWLAILVGFCGVLVITRPGVGEVHWAVGLSLAGAVAYALYNISTRVLASYDSALTTLFYSNLVGVLLASVPLPWLWSTPNDARVVTLMVAVGALGSVGHWLLILAHRKAPAGVLAPFIYAQLLGMVAMGYLVFGDVPDPWTLAGGTIVVASGLFLLMCERRPAPAETHPNLD
ncbi:DMT family transporter [Blastochloris viridis]|uniref:Membrane protein n=1 Tax=Blastochloris viridis TaxID=1079 RepID=A0A182D0R1_BLAVI|nr:DMT family transporter [Blastochloris viridis]BAR98491.1 membrane protein [Blastochloris viridis]